MERYGQFFVEARPFQFDVSNFFRVGLGCGPVGCISLLAMVPALIVTNGLFTFMGPSAPGSGFDQFVVFLSCVLSLTFLFSIALLALRYIFVANRERERESQATTEFLRGSLVWFKERYDFLWVQISKVDAELAIAQRDFADRAFVPFWSAAEKAAKALDLYMAGTLEMAKQARLYEECLTGREHNFPAWNSEIEWLPVPEGYVEQIRVLLRRADQDYEFSSIHQQRVIQKILLVGFEEVGKAILHLEGEMVKSIEGLRRALKADLTRLIYSQEAIRKILVNIATGGSKSNWSGE